MVIFEEKQFLQELEYLVNIDSGSGTADGIGQIASFRISMRYLFHFKSVPFSRSCFTIDGDRTRKIFSYGASACFRLLWLLSRSF